MVTAGGWASAGRVPKIGTIGTIGNKIGTNRDKSGPFFKLAHWCLLVTITRQIVHEHCFLTIILYVIFIFPFLIGFHVILVFGVGNTDLL